ncbi:BYS1 domain protein [Aspergillus sp. HF37]|nr:BYS1 domain protein [Aspergillus sp. HF37]
MHLPTLLTALSLSPLAHSISLPSTWWTNRAAPQALGNAIVTNNCANPIYLWSVGGSAGAQSTIKPQHAYTEPYRVDDQTGGVALKITTEENELYRNAPQLILAYALGLQTQRLYYDLSEKFGSPFRGHDVRLFAQGTENDGKAKADADVVIVWKNGVQPRG